jgi:hypothetical protein
MRDISFRPIIRGGIAVILAAFPLIAYANIDRTPTGLAAQETPAQVSVSADPAQIKNDCEAESWPFYSSNCLRAGKQAEASRKIELVATDAPLKALPRVIEAPETTRRVITADAEPAKARRAERQERHQRKRIVARRTRYPAAAMAANAQMEAPQFPMAFQSERAGW